MDLVIQDMNFTADTTSGEEGVALFREIRKRHPDLPVILLTAWTHLDAAVDLVKAGAADYLSKPWDDKRLLATVTNLIELGQANRALQQRVQRERRQRRELEQQVRPARHGVARPGHRTRAAPGLPGRARRRAGADHRARTAPARNASPKSSRPIPRCATARSSCSTAARCRPN